MIGYQVRRSSPTNLNDAINIARRDEEAKRELLMKTMGLNVEQNNFKAEMLNEIKRNQPRGNVNRNTNTRNARIMRCFECNEEGHIRPECPQLR
ncbi:unnamed protein product [Rhizophagus irregularis]|nr:unnamed protein product [Rhizophagus irregularis]